MQERSRFVEVADRVWVARHRRFDLNIAVIGGARGLLVVDTHGAESAARGVADAIRRLSPKPVVGIVNTHEHFDHVLGNAVFRDDHPAVPIHAHTIAAARTQTACDRVMAAAAEDDDPFAADVLASRIVPADRTFAHRATLDLGDRAVGLHHLGRGHTAGDAAITVPDAEVLLAGDLVEESAPPAYGPDSHPLDWPATLSAIVGLTAAGTVVVPGHGAIVDRDFVVGQQAQVADIAERIRACAAEGLTIEEALAAGGWPVDAAVLGDAVSRGYEQLASTDGVLPV